MELGRAVALNDERQKCSQNLQCADQVSAGKAREWGGGNWGRSWGESFRLELSTVLRSWLKYIP